MYDQSFNVRTLSFCFKPEDFQKKRNLSSDEERGIVINSAISRQRIGFLGYSLKSSVVRGKMVYWIDDLADILVLRKIKKTYQKLIR